MGVLEQQQVADRHWREQVERNFEEHMERLGRLEERADLTEKRMSTMADDLRVNTEATQRIEANTSTLVVWVTNVTGFRNTLNWFATLLLKLAGTAVALGILWWWFRTGELPHKADLGAPIVAGVALVRRPEGLEACGSVQVLHGARDLSLHAWGQLFHGSAVELWKARHNGIPLLTRRYRVADARMRTFDIVH